MIIRIARISLRRKSWKKRLFTLTTYTICLVCLPFREMGVGCCFLVVNYQSHEIRGAVWLSSTVFTPTVLGAYLICGLWECALIRGWALAGFILETRFSRAAPWAREKPLGTRLQPQPSTSAYNPYLDLDYPEPHPIIVYNRACICKSASEKKRDSVFNV